MALLRGLYEALVTEALAARLGALPSGLATSRSPLLPAEAPDRLALHLARVVERAVDALDDRGRTQLGVRLARQLVALLYCGPIQPGFRADDGRHAGIRSRFRDLSVSGARSDGTAIASTTGAERAERCEEFGMTD